MNVSPVNNVNSYSQLNLNDLPSDLTPAQVAAIKTIVSQLQTLNYDIKIAAPPEKGILEWAKNQLLGTVNNYGISSSDMPAVMQYIDQNQYLPPSA